MHSEDVATVEAFWVSRLIADRKHDVCSSGRILAQSPVL